MSEWGLLAIWRGGQPWPLPSAGGGGLFSVTAELQNMQEGGPDVQGRAAAGEVAATVATEAPWGGGLVGRGRTQPHP